MADFDQDADDLLASPMITRIRAEAMRGVALWLDSTNDGHWHAIELLLRHGLEATSIDAAEWLASTPSSSFPTEETR